jgi:phage-related protein
MTTYDLLARLRADASEFVSGVGEATRALGDLGGKVAESSDRMVDLGKTMSLSVTAPIVAGGTAAVLAFNEEEDAIARMQSALNATGGVAGVTGDHITEMARSLQQTTTFADDATISAAGLMLTFKGVRNEMGEGNDVFDRAIKASQDLSAFMGTDLNSSTMQLSKALQDPATGLNMLRRSGVSFTEQQQEQIKTMAEAGDTLGAQKIILAEVESQFGGTAATMAQTTSGEMKQAMNDLGDAMEQIGAVIAPVLVTVADKVKEAATWFQSLSPEVKTAVVTVAGLAAAIGPLLIGIGKAIQIGKQMRDTILAVKGVMMALNSTFLANPIFLVVAAIAALIAAAIWAYNNIEWFRNAVDAAWDGIQKAVAWAWGYIEPIWNAIVSWITGTLVPIFQQLWEDIKVAWDYISDAIQWAWTTIIQPIWNLIVAYIQNILIPYYQMLWNVVQIVFQGIVAAIQWAWNTVIKPVWDLLVAYIQNILVPYYQMLWNIVQFVFQAIANVVTWAWNSIIKPIWDNLYAFIETILVPSFQFLWNIVSTVWDGISSAIGAAWGFISGIFDSIRNGIATVAGWVGEKAQAIIDTFAGIGDGIIQGFKAAFNWIAEKWNSTIGGLSFSVPFTDISWDVPDIPMFHKGGMVPGQPGADVPAILQAGEFVLSRKMVSDLSALTPSSAASSSQYLAAALRRQAGDAAAASTGDTYNFTINGVVAKEKTELLSFLAQELPRAAAKHARSYG